ncbi:helix-turn-helix transcriptional regulator [Streptomyces cylindrosporus]|uniref:Helix-turn-helix domain-containing protein n=1 Tax=Streptomyces cylindrosporus TaxID=2927583 RepID=A0ABS9Y4I6_9ACTN|nr:helix-turn-helix domain-containing protein [Streptomyces cylindrosporus]MCI3272118.1 helix-turn-helix domain-containing protein [Streptomyces cylindrosporus]
MSELLASEANGYLTTKDVAARYRTAPSTVRYWRHIGYGPKGIKVGRRILYAPAEIQRFEKELAEGSARESA